MSASVTFAIVPFGIDNTQTKIVNINQITSMTSYHADSGEPFTVIRTSNNGTSKDPIVINNKTPDEIIKIIEEKSGTKVNIIDFCA